MKDLGVMLQVKEEDVGRFWCPLSLFQGWKPIVRSQSMSGVKLDPVLRQKPDCPWFDQKFLKNFRVLSNVLGHL